MTSSDRIFTSEGDLVRAIEAYFGLRSRPMHGGIRFVTFTGVCLIEVEMERRGENWIVAGMAALGRSERLLDFPSGNPGAVGRWQR